MPRAEDNTMALEFLKPITTPDALRSVQADASPLITTLLVLLGIGLEVGLCVWIHLATRKPDAKKEKKPGMLAKFFKK